MANPTEQKKKNAEDTIKAHISACLGKVPDYVTVDDVDSSIEAKITPENGNDPIIVKLVISEEQMQGIADADGAILNFLKINMKDQINNKIALQYL